MQMDSIRKGTYVFVSPPDAPSSAAILASSRAPEESTLVEDDSRVRVPALNLSIEFDSGTPLAWLFGMEPRRARARARLGEKAKDF
ncbi:hypothetical protein D5086_024093 [Populus alba]|uniref:Uncharacterized protein n=1 Tax=Populus alba TaxID=43335 RepID=A0ACC4B4S4_POPAL